MAKNWMIYGANGYSGELIAKQAVQQGQKPLLAGRSEESIKRLANELQLDYEVFSLNSANEVAKKIKNMDVVLNCAGPFSQTAKVMMSACVDAKTHYLDITGEIAVFELAHSMNQKAADAGIVLCPGVGFDVIPTDCLASQLKDMMPDATHLTLGFDSKSGFSPGTAKTSVEGLAQGGKVRKDGKITQVPLAYKTRKIDFGDGEKLAMTIPWGDVSTAYHSTEIPNIEVYIPASPRLVKRLKRLNWIKPVFKLGFVQNMMKSKIDKTVKGPSDDQRAKLKTYLWGEVKNAQGETKELRMMTSNGYTLTVDGSLKMVEETLKTDKSGFFTPSKLVNNKILEQL